MQNDSELIEELTAAEQAHYQALEEFSIDTKNIRFVESRQNWAKMMEFIREHDLETTAQNLRFAYLALTKDGLLDLLPLGHLAPPQQPQPEAPAPTAQPTPVAAPAFSRRGVAVAWKNGQPLNLDGAKRW